MGIPKFYRWLSERYPLLNMPVTATEAPPEIDNLYLDMNGIIHNCTHANDPTLRLTETEMVLRIFVYLDKLIHITKPKKLVLLAIDGVAPRAKMNQQRSRRFKSAQERLAHEAELAAKGEGTPEEYKFDSNCITPGTAFMARLGKHLRFFIRKKMSEDPVWQQPLVIFSGHDVPGEGEHKIMEYIRWQKKQPHYTPNQRHCMYGLDADLIMLSLVTHEPHFCLLREVVSFSGKNRGQPSRETLSNPCAENFILFQIGLLREYVELEFTDAMSAKALSFTLDVERVIDDIVLFCMLVGNDFLPPLPTLDIAEGALNKLIDTYKLLLPQLGGYLTHAGELNHQRLQVLLGAIADAELQTLEDRAADTEWFESKKAKRGGRGGGRSSGIPHSSSRSGGNNSSRSGQLSAATAAAAAMGEFSNGTFSSGAYAALEDLDSGGDELVGGVGFGGRGGGVAAAAALAVPLVSVLGELEPDPVEEQGPTMMRQEARQLFLNGGGEEALAAWKLRYYKEKLELPDASPTQTAGVVEHYIRGLHWVLQYYYRGVASWDWFYPYHYAPMAQDMRQLGDIDVSFTRGRPFKPFEQLLAVLPSASAALLPPAFQWLMTDPRSPILDFYPEKFDIDMEGKRAEWEGVVKVPFVSESRLLEAAASIPLDSLSAEERKRNDPGDMLVFEWASGWHEAEHCVSTLTGHFANITHAHSICRQVPPPEPLPGNEPGFVPSLAKGTMTGKRNPPGFPTLKTMSNLTVELKLAGVNVFGNPSKKESVVLVLPDVRGSIAADAAAPLLRSMLCGRVYVKWPYLQEAEIVAVSDARQRMSTQGVLPHAPEEAAKWQMIAGQTKNMFLTKTGIDIGALPVVLDVRVCTGHKRELDGSVRKEYAKELAVYPLQAVLQSRPRPPPGFADPDAPKPLALQPGSRAVWVGANYFGAVATVLADPAAKITGRQTTSGYLVRVQPLHQELLYAESRARQSVQQYALDYMPSGAACQQLRVHPRLLGRITGNIWVNDSQGERVDIGLAVKNAKQGLCVPAMCKPFPDGNGWLYSAALVDLVRQYKTRFPGVFAALDPAAQAFGGGGGGRGGGDGGGEGDRQKLGVADLFPHAAPEEHERLLEEVRSWLKAQISSKHPLVPISTQQASDAAVDRLQIMLPGLMPLGTAALVPVDLESVHPSLLLPPHDPSAATSVLAGGTFEPGDRVVVLTGTGAPAFGARGTVIGVMPTSVEVLMDEDYAGGTTLKGRLRGPRGAYLPPEQLLNVSRQHPVRYVGQKPRVVARQQQQQRALQQAKLPAAAAAGSVSPTSPTGASPTVATSLAEVAPWLKGRQLQQIQARQSRTVGATAAAAQEAAAASESSPAQQEVRAPGPPTFSQGSKLLQMLRKQGKAPEQQQQQQLPQEQQQQLLLAAAVPQAGAVGPQPSELPPPPGQALLLQLQRGVVTGPGRQQQPQPQLPPQPQLLSASQAAFAAQPVGPRAPAASGDGTAAGDVAASALQQLSLDSSSSSDNTKQRHVPGPPPASAGASLLAMLQRPSAQRDNRPLHTTQQTRQQPAAAAAGDAALTAVQPDVSQQQPKQQKKGAGPANVRVVPRPSGNSKKQEQQQQNDANVVSASSATELNGQLSSSSSSSKQQQQQQEFKKRDKSKQQAPQLGDAPAAAAASSAGPLPAAPAALKVAVTPAPDTTSRSRRSDDATTATPPARSPQPPPAAAASSSSTPPPQQQQAAPRTPPAGAGSGLLSAQRGEKVIQAKLPDGTRGFTLGRGQRIAAASSGSSSPLPAAAVAAPGSSSSSTPPVCAGVPAPGSAAAPAAAAPQHTVRAQPARAAAAADSQLHQVAMTPPRPSAAAAAASDGVVAAGSGAPGGVGPTPLSSTDSGQLLMRILQRGNSRNVAPVSPQQPAPQEQQQQPAQQPVPAFAVAGPATSPEVSSSAAAAIAANSTAACNLLRRLQSRGNQPPAA